ncbi:Holliday junction resolvase RuvX, partial [Neisseria gonorrhoeae]
MHKIPKGTALAFDFGEARIGVAQGDAELGLSHPLATVTGGSNDEKFAAIAKLVQ